MKHAMKVILIACFFVSVALPASAELTKQEIIDYNDRYKELYAQCNIETFVAYLQTYFHPGYKARLRLPTGQAIVVDKAQLVELYVVNLKNAKASGEVVSNCSVNSDILDISTDGDKGVVKIQQREEARILNPVTGAMQNITMLTVCNHMVEKMNGKLMIMSSSCVSRQEL